MTVEIIFYLFIFALGLGWFFIRLFQWKQASRASRWPVITGVLDSVKLKRFKSKDGDTWMVKIRYNYFLNGDHYWGKKFAFGYEASADYNRHERIYLRLKYKKLIKIRVDPQNPSNSCISHGMNIVLRESLVMNLVIVLLCLVIGIFWIRYRLNTGWWN